MKALIQDGLVVQVCDAEFEVHQSLCWVDATQDCEAGWSYDSGVFTPPQEPTKLPCEALRRAAYAAEADPLFFKAQRGEAAVQEWQDKVAEIKARYPKEAA